MIAQPETFANDLQKDLRQSRRLRASGIVAFLRASDASLPSLPCIVENLSLGGCRCRAMLERLLPASATAWREAVSFGSEFELDLLTLPALPIVRVSVDTRYVDVINDESSCEGIAFGLQFSHLNGEEYSMLSHAMGTLEGTVSHDESEINRTSLAGKRITRILAELGRVTESTAERAERNSLTSGKSVAHYLLRRGLVNSHEYTHALALQAQLPSTDLAGAELTPELLALFPTATLLQHRFLPIDRMEEIVCIAVGKPLAAGTIRTLEKRFNCKLYVFLAPEEQVNALLRQLDPQPTQISRDHARVAASYPVRFKFNEDDLAFFNGDTQDLSMGGFSLSCTDDLSLCGVCIHFMINVGFEIVRGVGSIRFVRKTDEAQDRWVAGVEILELSSEDRAALARALAKE